MPINKYGDTPKHIICDKAKSKDDKDLINSLFDDCLYIPLFRDNEKGDVIVEQPRLKLNNEEIDMQNFNSPGKNMNLKSHNQMKLAAYVGPLSPNRVIYYKL